MKNSVHEKQKPARGRRRWEDIAGRKLEISCTAGRLKTKFFSARSSEGFNRDMDAAEKLPQNHLCCVTKAGTPGGSAPFENPFWRTVFPPKSVENKPSGKPH
jgi:hypothetical protein